MRIVERERAKYDELWKSSWEYRAVNPGVDNVERFLEVVQPDLYTRFKPASILDIGCGTGSAGLKFASLGYDVWWLDFSEAGLSPDVPRNRFLQVALWDRFRSSTSLWWDYGFCCDVMEHVPPEFTMLCLHRILSSCRLTWFAISLVEDNCGQLIGEKLHLTVRPFTWWLDRFAELGATVVDARDLIFNGFYLVKRI